jgi:hypothetical protein
MFYLVMGIPIQPITAVGMTFEQGGIGRKEVLMENGSSLTIKDRLTSCKAVLTAVEVATSESDKLIEGLGTS